MADGLVVDDDMNIADTLADVLVAEGHRVRVARDGAEGLVLLRQRLPDLVLLDVEMPVLTGPEMAHLMLVHDCGQELIPIVLLSGVLDLSGVARIVRTPYFLPKPFTLDGILAMIHRALVERTPPWAIV